MDTRTLITIVAILLLVGVLVFLRLKEDKNERVIDEMPELPEEPEVSETEEEREE